MKTAWQTTHKHTVAGKATTSTGGHSHDLAEVEAALLGHSLEIDALAARIAALEAPPPPPPVASARVTSIPDLLTRLEEDDLDELVLANGTYRVSPAASKRSDSLWIGAKFAGRTRPVLVRAETTGGVTFDGGGATYFGGISFEEGAHDQTWQGFVFANGTPTQTGVISFGGYAGMAAPHHITLRDIVIPKSIVSASTGSGDHALYFSQAVGGPHDILIDGLRVDGSGGVDSALHFFHSDAVNANAWNVTVRRLAVTATDQAIVVWDATIRNLLIEDSTITGATGSAIRYEAGQVTLRRVASTSSGQYGFYSSKGPNPPGVTFDACDLR